MMRWTFALWTVWLCCFVGRADDPLPVPASELIKCKGRIESYTPRGFECFAMEGGCEVYDVTWVIVTVPSEFSGVRHMMLSSGGVSESPYGAVGSEITFDAFRCTLDSEQHPELGRVDQKALTEELRGATGEEDKAEEQSR